MTVTETATAVKPNYKTTKLLAIENSYGDFRDDLARDGFAVVKGTIAREKAEAYGDKFYSYLEDLYVSHSSRLQYLYSD